LQKETGNLIPGMLIFIAKTGSSTILRYTINCVFQF
jgi:hypothetical protein